MIEGFIPITMASVASVYIKRRRSYEGSKVSGEIGSPVTVDLPEKKVTTLLGLELSQ